MLTEQQQQQLLDAARLAREHAYAPYSEFPVGAAVLTEEGTITTGANVENASYGLTICAERIAAGAAVAAGARKIVATAIVSSGGTSPCGACRQFLAEFGEQMQLLLLDADDSDAVHVTSLDQLLPQQFRLSE